MDKKKNLAAILITLIGPRQCGPCWIYEILDREEKLTNYSLVMGMPNLATL